MLLDLYEKEKQLISENRRAKFEYREFIESRYWEAQKLVWYSRHKKICARCKSDKNINLHHKRYPKNGRYLSMSDNDFAALCRRCHHRYHWLNGVQQHMHRPSVDFIKQGYQR
jgi:5-methylcytosine-specific restriction endonuclease McrA